MEVVTRQIAENAGYDGPMTIAECYNKKLGFNALTGEYEDLLDTGVINSVKVDRYSLINATSLAATVITMGGYVVEENEPESNVFQLQAPIGGGNVIYLKEVEKWKQMFIKDVKDAIDF